MTKQFKNETEMEKVILLRMQLQKAASEAANKKAIYETAIVKVMYFRLQLKKLLLRLQ